MSCDQTADAPGAINAIKMAVTPIANAFDATPTKLPRLGNVNVLRARSRSSMRRQTSRFSDCGTGLSADCLRVRRSPRKAVT